MALIQCLDAVSFLFFCGHMGPTILGEDVQALLHAQGGVEDYKAVADGQHVIAGPGLEEGANGALLLSASIHGRLECCAEPYQAV